MAILLFNGSFSWEIVFFSFGGNCAFGLRVDVDHPGAL